MGREAKSSVSFSINAFKELNPSDLDHAPSLEGFNAGLDGAWSSVVEGLPACGRELELDNL